MAKYEVQVDGSTYEVEGPDDREPSESEVRGLLGGNTDTAAAMTPENQPEESSGFSGHFGPTAFIKTGLSGLNDLTQGKITESYGQRFNPFQRDAEAAWTTGNKALEQIQQGHPGDAALTVGKAIPFIGGPLEAGEDVIKGKPGAWGAVAGELGNLALIGLGKAFGKSIPKTAGSLGEAAENSANKSYVKGLNPTKRYLATAEKIAPDLMKQGVWGTVPSLEEAASSGLDKAGPLLDEAWQKGGARELPIGGIKQALQEHIQSLSPIGAEAEPLSASKAAAAQNLIDYLNRNAPEGNISAEQARSLRQLWDDPVARRNAYMPGADPNLTASVEAARTGANALRSTIADIVPEAVEPNKQFKLYSDLQDVLDHRKAGSKGVAATMLGTVAGSSLGPLGALKGAMVAKILHSAMQSPAWNTFSAVQKAKIARGLVGLAEVGSTGRGVNETPEGPAQLPGNVYDGSFPADIALREAQTNSAPVGPFEPQSLSEAAAYEETPFAKAQRLGQTGVLPQTWDQATGSVFEPGVGADPSSDLYNTFNAPPEAPFNIPTAAQPTLQTKFGKSSSFQLPLETPELPQSILQEAFINELLQQARRR